MLGGGRSYQIPEVLNEAPYDKSVDMYLYGLLAYELLVGKAAYPPDMPDLEHNIQISNYVPLPGDVSVDAKDLIQRLVLAEPDKRLTLAKVKRHLFFNSAKWTVDWKAVYDGQMQMPKI